MPYSRGVVSEMAFQEVYKYNAFLCIGIHLPPMSIQV